MLCPKIQLTIPIFGKIYGGHVTSNVSVATNQKKFRLAKRLTQGFTRGFT